MVKMRKESWAAESLRNAKDTESIFVPLDYNYGQNFNGPKGRETRPPHIDEKVKKDKVYED